MGVEEKIAAIHDADLRAEIEAARGGFLLDLSAPALFRLRLREEFLVAVELLDSSLVVLRGPGFASAAV